ncbi:Kef-type K+ transport system membrane component KefB [Agromyces terreus]|uniref:Kef-type K+ transport system membrane component KefB n=1 Tax=Agromyces terreus TaxID=424795 RepID=A0A9X2H2V2_9MICO|nr:cation:proton antiporter [Agromyces terreus]MCP2372171.1 Kef-type K+ transport system membrane component KefB [Agromyces terreus]
MVLIPLIAVAAPLLVRAVGYWVSVPLVVFEIVLGIVLGPDVLGWIQPDDFVEVLSELGLAMLFFLAGSEIDFRAIRGRPMKRAAVGWIISLAAGIGVAVLFAPDIPAAAFIGIALTSTALGTVMPILRDSGDLKTPFGLAVIALGAIGEFGPLLAISLFLTGRTPGAAAIVLLAFAVIAGIALYLAAKGHGKRLHVVITATMHTSGQFGVRLVILVLSALVALSIVLDLDMLLGAFTAGVLFRVMLSGAPKQDVHAVETKIEGLGYGFVVPIFFIVTGVTFDLKALADPGTLLLVPLFVVLLLIVRGVPSMLAAPVGADGRTRAATALFGATGLPIIVAVTAIGVETGDLGTGTAAALVGAGMITVLVFPLVGLAIRKHGTDAARHPQDDTVDVPIEG